MFKLTPTPAPKDRARLRRWFVPGVLLFQLSLVVALAAMMLGQTQATEETDPESPSRLRYVVTRQEWPGGVPTLKQIHDRYAGDLPAMRFANQPGSCADPDAPIDYGDVIFIEFSPSDERCGEGTETTGP